MGRRDEPELTPSDAEMAETETATRELLARYGEPAPAQPPAGLVSRVLAALPEARPGPSARRPWWAFPRPVALWGLASLAALLIAVGGGAALAPSLPAIIVAAGPLGRLSAAIASPSLGTLLGVPAPAALLIGLGIAVSGLVWWRLRREK